MANGRTNEGRSTRSGAAAASASGSGNSNNTDVVRQTIAETLEAPRLQGLMTTAFVEFKKKRQVYENKINDKNKEPGVNITATSYRNSLDDFQLKTIWRAKWVTCDTWTSVTEAQLKLCVEERSKVDFDDAKLDVLDKVVKSVRMDMLIKDAETRVWSLVSEYEKKLETYGCADIPEKRPHIAIGHMMDRLKPSALKDKMKLVVRSRKHEGLHRKDFQKFMEEVVTRAKAIEDADVYVKAKPGFDSESSDTDENERRAAPRGGGSRRTRRGRYRIRRGRKRGESARVTDSGNDSGDTAPPATKKTLPSCLNPDCKMKHFLKDCKDTPEHKKKVLIEEYHKRKQRAGRFKTGGNGKGGKLMRLGADAFDNHSTLFTATFCKGAIESVVMADGGADVNVIPPKLFHAIQKASPIVKVVNLEAPRFFNQASETAPQITCEKLMTTDVELRIRHGTTLVLRCVEWAVSDTEMQHALIGRPLLEALGIQTKHLIAAACDRFGGEVDVSTLLPSEVENNTEPKSGSIAQLLRDAGIFHSEGGAEEDCLEESNVYVDLGEDDPNEVDTALKLAVQNAKCNGLSEKGAAKLQSLLLFRFRSIFRLRLGKTEPAKVPPMKIDLIPSARPVRAKARRYHAGQRAFLNRYTEELLQMGFIRPNPNASWQSAPLLVPKTSRERFRMAIDLRPLNSATVKKSWPMPHIDSEVFDFKSSKVFAVLDFVSGYWQLPVAPESQDACGIVTPNGVYSSTRVLQGLTNAAAHFQSTVEPLFASLRANLKAWLDDFNLHAKTEAEILGLLEKFFEICEKFGLFLSARKCQFFTHTVRWCGRIITGDGVKMDPSRLSGLEDIHPPATAGELCELIHCCRWMSIGIPAFAETIAPLNELLERAYAKAGRRTKRSVKNIALSTLSWGPEHDTAFKTLQGILLNATTLSYPDTRKTICVYTDASDQFWSAVVTQTDPCMLSAPVKEQKHEPMAFLGAAFKGAELGWSTYEKEAFAIFQVFDKLDYMFLGDQPVHVFTDHRNLLFVFSPLSMEPALGRHIVSKVQRWALFLSRFAYSIEHVDGKDNIFADILTRWLRGYRADKKRLGTLCRFTRAAAQIVPSPVSDDFVWPCAAAIVDAQRRAEGTCAGCTLGADGIMRKDNCIWIPDSDVDLQLKIMVVSHCSLMGHRGKDATESVIRENFTWSQLSSSVDEFVKQCLHCLVTRTGEVVPRPLGTALHGSKPNEVVHCDFLYMGDSTEHFKYVLIVRDDLSSYSWLWPCTSADSEATATVLAKWVSTFGTMDWLVTDQGSHFKNELILELRKEFGISHHFTTAYSPWANGSVERVCREVKRVCRAFLSEWGLAPQDWPAVLNCMQSVLNHSPLRRLGLRNKEKSRVYRSPLEVFTGMRPTRPLLRALPMDKFPTAVEGELLQAQRLMDIDAMQSALEGMHRDVSDRIDSARKKRIVAHNARTRVVDIDFEVGSFVLVRRAQKKGHKLHFLWRGPRRVVSLRSPHVYEVQDLLKGKKEIVHARRLILYRADMDGKEIDPELLKFAEHSERTYESVSRLRRIRQGIDSLEIEVEWDGLPDKVDLTWEPLIQVHEDVPDVLERFLRSSGQRKLKNSAKVLIAKA